MPGTTIGTSMNLGYPGTYSRNGDFISFTRLINPGDSTFTGGNTGTVPGAVYFGDAVLLVQNSATNGQSYYTDAAAYILNGGTFSFAANGTVGFIGFALREVKSAQTFNPTVQLGYYSPGEPCDVIERGSVTITLQNPQATAVKAGGPVYIRVSTNGSFPSALVGGIEPASDGGHTVQLTNCMWTTGLVDANNSVEVTLISRNLP